MYWGSTPYNGGPDGKVGRLIASSAAIVSISDSMKGAVGRVLDLRNGSAPVQKDPRWVTVSASKEPPNFCASIRRPFMANFAALNR
jgi:hypothetical protein